MSLERLNAHLIETGSNLNDRAIVLISECIKTGIDRGPDIVRTVSALGLNKASVGAQLRHGTGPNPDQHRWFKTADGRYRLHP